MLSRKVYQKLVEWKAQKTKKALCIIGARQIGKTTLVRFFGKKNYKSFVELNFITDPAARAIFQGNYNANELITNITAYTKKSLISGQTLVFFDEVQACPEVRTAIKFLVEDGRFDYVESGSLLGVRYNDVESYAVGFEEIYYMYPMDFEEYAMACGVQPETFTYLEKCFATRTPVLTQVHETFLKLFFSYLVVGGMPKVVQTYVTTHDIGRVVEEQQDILELYRMDISKYAEGADKLKIKGIFDSIPAQLNNKNRRFMLSKLDENGRQNRYQRSFLWLANAGVALPCYNISEPKSPLKLNVKHNLFKLYMADTGLLCASCMENIQFSLLQGDLEINMGSILENIMAQSLKANGFEICYFDSKKYGELDFVIQNGLQVDYVEIKSGHDYKVHAALNKVMSVTEWKYRNALVFCKGNVEQQDNVTYLPWYMVIFYKPCSIPLHTQYAIDLSALNDLVKK